MVDYNFDDLIRFIVFKRYELYKWLVINRFYSNRFFIINCCRYLYCIVIILII